MATVVNPTSQLTLMELAKRTNDKNLLTIAEVLTKEKAILADGIAVESNQPTSHVGTKRTNLPAGSWRRINKGVQTEASSTKQITEAMGMLESYSQIDKRLVDLSANKQEFRSQEDLAFIEGLSQTVETALIYGATEDNPEQIDGFASRYNATTMDNVYDAGGGGSDTTSLWIIQWATNKVHLIYPPGGNVGIHAKDLGEMRVESASGYYYQAYVTHFAIDTGIFVHDDRCVQRIANIETSGTTNILDDDTIIEALNQMPQRGGGAGTAIYVNRTLCTQFDILAKDKANVNYSSDNAFGEMVTRFRGTPIRLCESIVDTETAI
jgi:hypothetical protein